MYFVNFINYHELMSTYYYCRDRTLLAHQSGPMQYNHEKAGQIIIISASENTTVGVNFMLISPRENHYFLHDKGPIKIIPAVPDSFFQGASFEHGFSPIQNGKHVKHCVFNIQLET